MESVIVKKPKKYGLADCLFAILLEQSNHMHLVYYHIFSIMNKKELQDVLSYTKKVWKGKDKFFGKEGKESWFYNFHKSMRQTDFFDNCYTQNEIKIMTKSEINEFKFLQSKVHEDGYDKEAGKSKSEIFGDEYLRYLELNRKRLDQKRDRPITGHLDMILWNAIHLDTKQVLYNTLIEVFKR